MGPNLILCDKTPFCPNGLKLVEHRTLAPLYWNPGVTTAHRTIFQEKGVHILGKLLREKLQSVPCLNGCVLDFLRKNPDRIPVSEWGVVEDGYPLLFPFFGSIYEDTNTGHHIVRCLQFYDGAVPGVPGMAGLTGWHEIQRHLGNFFTYYQPIPILRDG